MLLEHAVAEAIVEGLTADSHKHGMPSIAACNTLPEAKRQLKQQFQAMKGSQQQWKANKQGQRPKLKGKGSKTRYSSNQRTKSRVSWFEAVRSDCKAATLSSRLAILYCRRSTLPVPSGSLKDTITPLLWMLSLSDTSEPTACQQCTCCCQSHSRHHEPLKKLQLASDAWN